MIILVPDRGESSPAVLANARFATRMRSQVNLKVLLLGEDSSATFEGATVRLIILVKMFEMLL
jgi:hypothetical protein